MDRLDRGDDDRCIGRLKSPGDEEGRDREGNAHRQFHQHGVTAGAQDIPGMEVTVADPVTIGQGGKCEKQPVAQVLCQGFGAFDIGRQPRFQRGEAGAGFAVQAQVKGGHFLDG